MPSLLPGGNVPMAIGSGTEVVKEMSHVILIKRNMRGIVVAVDIAKVTLRRRLFDPFFKQVVSPELAALGLFIALLTVCFGIYTAKVYREGR